MTDVCLLTAALLVQRASLQEHPIAPDVAAIAPSAPRECHSPSVRPMAAVPIEDGQFPIFSSNWQTTLAPVAESLLPVPASEAIASPAPAQRPRPYSGSQLYQQRVAALRAGRTYTRLVPDSFQDQWLDAQEQPTYEQWVDLLKREAIAMAQGQGHNRLTVLVGDSLYLWYPTEQLAGDRFWLNQGISGDTTAGVLRRLQSFASTRPDIIHVMVGINDLRRGATDAAVVTNLQRIMRQLRQTHPHSRILIHSLLPTRLPNIAPSRILQINQAVAHLAHQERVDYLDVHAYFVDAGGGLRPDLTTDGLHLNDRGYATWAIAWRSLVR